VGQILSRADVSITHSLTAAELLLMASVDLCRPETAIAEFDSAVPVTWELGLWTARGSSS
jgi:hypothetical protein